MNCKSPGPIVPLFPAKSSWSTPPDSRYVIVSCPRCGWSGNPAPGDTEKWSSIRNGVRWRRVGVPTLRRTVAPAPSDCWRARKANWIPRGVVILPVFAPVEAKWVGIKGRWERVGAAAIMCEVVTVFVVCSRLLKKGLACWSIEFDARLS